MYGNDNVHKTMHVESFLDDWWAQERSYVVE